ncbi:MAG: hypothetical protein JRG69_13155 [Deltaproteobacteria bacterium]|nr:hypothetical protein [Deltaproteobacteria bacterium]
MRLMALLFVLLVGCGAPVIQQTEEVYVEPLFGSELPEPPEAVDPSKRIVLSVSECTVEGSEPPEKTHPGIYMTKEMGARVGHTKVYADELRGLYEIDLRTMDRERVVYQKQLDMADQEVERLRERARRSWLEKNRGWIGLGVGLVVGAGLAIGMAAALDGVTDAVP